MNAAIKNHSLYWIGFPDLVEAGQVVASTLVKSVVSLLECPCSFVSLPMKHYVLVTPQSLRNGDTSNTPG